MAPGSRRRAWAAAQAVAAEFGFARHLLRRIAPALLIAFACIGVPLWAFGELADEVEDGEPFAFDAPLLLLARATASPLLDDAFVLASALGYGWGVIPADIALVAWLTVRRRFAKATFAAVALGGSALLNVAAKHHFQRARPELWPSIAPESTYSFPSGHAMGSATLACVVAVLCWRTRARWPVIAAGIAFAGIVGASRVYLGVHYPSDIVAGWCAAMAWTLSVHGAMKGGRTLRAQRVPTSGGPVHGRERQP